MTMQLKDGLVSVVMPAWNRADTIGDAITSALAQTYEALEVVVVDDASSDATATIVQTMSTTDHRIRLVTLGKNSGCAAARTVALEQARGQYVAFLDADDVWLPHKIEKQVAALRQCDAAICFGSYRRFREDPRTAGPLVPVPRSVTYRELLRSNVIGTLTCLVDRERTGRFAMVQTFHDDYATWLSLLKPGRWALGLQNDLARYRITPGSLSRGKLHSWSRVWDIYRRCEGLNLPLATAYSTLNAAHAFLRHWYTAT